MVERVERSSATTSSANSASRLSIHQLAPAAIVFTASLLLYGWTLAPTVTLVDSGELIVAAKSLGVAHPPGFPLYVLLTHVATMVPLGNVAQRANFASAIFAAVAAGAVTLAAFEALESPRGAARPAPTRSRGRKKKADAASPAVDSIKPDAAWPIILPSITAGLLFATSRTLWSYATVAEVYTLNSMLLALCIFFLFRWRRLVLDSEAESSRRQVRDQGSANHNRQDRWLYAAAVSFGLGLGVHHVTIGLMLPAFGFLVLRTEGARFFASRRFLFTALFALGGLSVYLYLPLAASASPIMNWGDPRTFDRFWSHVTGRQYQAFFESGSDKAGEQLREFAGYALREFGLRWIPLASALVLAGLAHCMRRVRVLFWFVAIAVVVNLIYNSRYEIAEDKDAYYLPVFIVLAVLLAFGARVASEAIATLAAARTGVDRGRGGLVAALLILAIVPSVSFGSNLPFNNRRQYFIARDYVRNILTTVEPHGMLLTLDWQVYSPLLYLREVEQFRRDAVVIDVNQLRRSWYFAYLEQAYPDTMAAARTQVDDFLEDLRDWEKNPELYNQDVRLNRRISERFQDLILTFISSHVRSNPVYLTQDIAVYREGRDIDWVEQINRRYAAVPQGLVFQLFGDRGFHEPSNQPMVTRGLVDGSLRFDDKDVVKLKILPVYSLMFYNRGRYLAAAGRHAEAAEAFNQSLAMDPGFSAAARGLAESQAAAGR